MSGQYVVTFFLMLSLSPILLDEHQRSNTGTDDIDLTDKSYIGRALISVNNAAKKLGVNNLTVTTPEIAFETAFSSLGLGSLDVFTEFATFRIGEIDFFASAEQEAQDEEDSSLTDIFAYLTLDNVWLLHNIINRFMGAFDSRIRVRGGGCSAQQGGGEECSEELICSFVLLRAGEEDGGDGRPDKQVGARRSGRSSPPRPEAPRCRRA